MALASRDELVGEGCAWFDWDKVPGKGRVRMCKGGKVGIVERQNKLGIIVENKKMSTWTKGECYADTDSLATKSPAVKCERDILPRYTS